MFLPSLALYLRTDLKGRADIVAARRGFGFDTLRPAILGLAVPGMPMNSPGMEIESEKGEPFDVIAFAADGQRTVFMEVRP